ncbi:MAG: M48 family metalloprotease [Gammaproteobacteria bacterium]
MRYLMWLSAPILIMSLLGHIWFYAGYILRLPLTWVLLIAGSMLLVALVGLFLLRPLCRALFGQTEQPGWILQLLSQLSHRLGMRQPELHVIAADGINAFALGDARTGGVILFHGQLLSQLTQDEVESVMAHELAHLEAGHAMLMTFLQGMSAPLLAPVAACASLFMSVLFGIGSLRQHFIQIYHMLSVLVFPITSLLIALVMRQWEYTADAQAARLVGKSKYIAALQCLHGSFFHQPDLLNLTSNRTAAENDQWALSHPRLKQRIQALRELG